MITQIKGKLIEKNPTTVILDCNGIGYLLHISLYTFSALGEEENLKLYTYLQIKEDAHTLFGFVEKAEREIFKLLLSVSGVGASTARTMLSSLDPQQVQEAIAKEDVTTIKAVKGIGAKTAQRIILDLKDKILKVFAVDEVSSTPNNTDKDEALSALETLGFNRKLAEKAIAKVCQESPNATVETIIKQALKNI